MKYNYIINIYEEYADGTWRLQETVETRPGYYGVIDGRVHIMNDGRSIGESPMTQEEAKARHCGRYFEIAGRKQIVDYVIGTFDICRFNVRYSETWAPRFVLRVQLVNTREPYYFVQENGANWKFCRTIANGTDMQELRAAMDKYFDGNPYEFADSEERKQFEDLF